MRGVLRLTARGLVFDSYDSKATESNRIMMSVRESRFVIDMHRSESVAQQSHSRRNWSSIHSQIDSRPTSCSRSVSRRNAINSSKERRRRKSECLWLKNGWRGKKPETRKHFQSSRLIFHSAPRFQCILCAPRRVSRRKGAQTKNGESHESFIVSVQNYRKREWTNGT